MEIVTMEAKNTELITEDKSLKKKIRLHIAGFLAVAFLTACGEDPELVQFRNSIEDFCTEISQIDTAINSIDASSESAVSDLLSCLDDLEDSFRASLNLTFRRNLTIWRKSLNRREITCPLPYPVTTMPMAGIPTMNILPLMPAKTIPALTNAYRSLLLFCTEKRLKT